MLFGNTSAQPQIGLDEINKIRLLESNRNDVRRILAAYKLEPEEEHFYDRFYTRDAEIRVDYSEGNCKEFGSGGFEVPQLRATYIEIELNNPVKPKDLNINLSKYKKEKRYYNIDDWYVYHDKQAGIIFDLQEGKLGAIVIVPSSRYYNLMCDKERAKKLSATSSIFDEPLKQRSATICPADINANVDEIKLSRAEIFANEDANKIDVVTKASDPDGDVLIYHYTVSDGTIVGKGANVVWDLTGVEPGTYKITAAVDDGCGFCGKTQTKSIVIKECRGCH